MNHTPENDQSILPTPEVGKNDTAGAAQEPTPATGRRQAFRDLRRQLTDEDLRSAGVQKLLLDDLERAETRCESLSSYVDRFHTADKQAAVLEERIKTDKASEISFGVGIGLGGAVMGLAPLFWNEQPRGWLALGIGVALIIGATITRAVRR